MPDTKTILEKDGKYKLQTNPKKIKKNHILVGDRDELK